MKTVVILSICLGLCGISYAQNSAKQLPSAVVKKLDGSNFDTKNLNNNGKPMIISFWATWCAPCKRELNNIAEVYEDWVDETGVKLVAVSIDDTRSSSRVKPYVDGVNWDYEILLDPGYDFKRAMNVNNVPHTFLIDGNNEVVYQHNNYSPGDEDELYEKLLGVSGE